MRDSKRSRPLSPALLISALLALPAAIRAGELDDVIESFEDNARYVEPLATLYGSMTNSGWYQSAGVSGLFSVYFGLPISVVNIADDDRTYDATFTDDGCVAYRADGGTGSNCQEKTSFKAPTVFGRGNAPVNKRSVYNGNSKTIIDTLDLPVSDGFAEVADFNWFPFLMPQLSVSAFNTELKLRYIMLPIGDFSLSAYGVGIQHDLSSFLPVLPVSLSLAANFSKLGAEFTPGDNITGTLELDGTSYFVGALVGYNLLGMLEVFAEAGWEGASLQTGGDLTITAGGTSEDVHPNLDVDGRNGFRAALNVAFHFGYQAVVGQNVGANIGNQFNLLGFRLKI